VPRARVEQKVASVPYGWALVRPGVARFPGCRRFECLATWQHQPSDSPAHRGTLRRIVRGKGSALGGVTRTHKLGSRVRVPPLLSSEASRLPRVAGLSSCGLSTLRASAPPPLAPEVGHFLRRELRRSSPVALFRSALNRPDTSATTAKSRAPSCRAMSSKGVPARTDTRRVLARPPGCAMTDEELGLLRGSLRRRHP
jgi:hypothetical protein